MNKNMLCGAVESQLDKALRKHKHYLEDKLLKTKEKYGEESSEYTDCLCKLAGFWETITTLNSELGSSILTTLDK